MDVVGLSPSASVNASSYKSPIGSRRQHGFRDACKSRVVASFTFPNVLALEFWENLVDVLRRLVEHAS